MSTRATSLSNILRRIAGREVQVASQYLGRSLSPDWQGDEIVIVKEEKVSIVVLSSQDATADAAVCAGILLANPGSRVILIRDDMHAHLLDIQTELRPRIREFQAFEHLRETADLVLLLAAADDLLDATIGRWVNGAFAKYGFTNYDELSDERKAFMQTALQAEDVVATNIGPGWEARIFKTFYPIIRDSVPYRGLIAGGQVSDRFVTFFKETNATDWQHEVRRLKSLVSCFAGAPEPAISERDLASLIQRPGNLDAFIDEVYVPGEPLPGILVRDFLAYAAVVVPADRYPQLLEAFGRFRKKFNAPPDVTSSDFRRGRGVWAGIPREQRGVALREWLSVLKDSAISIPYLFCGAEDFFTKIAPGITSADMVPENWDWGSHRAVTQLVFLKALTSFARKEDALKSQLVLVRGAHDGERLGILQIFADNVRIAAGGVHQVSAHDSPGLLLAKLAVAPPARVGYAHATLHGDSESFDAVLSDFFLKSGRDLYHHLLGGKHEDLIPR